LGEIDKMGLILSSDGIIDGIIDDKYGKRTRDLLNGIPQLSFPLSWSGGPLATASYALIFLDRDNIIDEGVLWIHWLVANIPPEIHALPEDAGRNMRDVSPRIVQGLNTWGAQGVDSEGAGARYGGPSPEKFSHRYEINLYALNGFLNLKSGFGYPALRDAMKDRVLSDATLYGEYPV
jgi:Raf kinase inhibitor-like YbhB/YbcL family protein